ncbi:MAG: hypothetical protein HUU41_00735 [Bryobacteraceae bacterium]|nr:hypothetical protein [Bryobacterales bacterium]MEB2363073.1 hypothetical protein [Bryobacterales bacterium]NUM99612.1 hypothetical protein [Bryobacteraceae bacterium]
MDSETLIYATSVAIRQPDDANLCSTVDLMDRSTAELAIKALEAERQKIDSAIQELRSLVKDDRAEAEPVRRSRISPAGLKRISEASKRRWANARKAQALAAQPARTKKKSAASPRPVRKKGGLTPEGRARLAEAIRQRNIARAAAKKTAAKVG